MGCGGSGGGSSASTTSTSPSGSAGSRSQPAGDNSIQTFGQEATGSDRSSLTGAFGGYLGAMAVRDYSKACTFLSRQTTKSLEQIVVAQLRAKGCTAILPKLLSGSASVNARQQAAGAITAVRVKGDRAFVLYHAPGARLYTLTMVREKGAWKVTTLTGTVLIPSPATLGQGVRR